MIIKHFVVVIAVTLLSCTEANLPNTEARVSANGSQQLLQIKKYLIEKFPDLKEPRSAESIGHRLRDIIHSQVKSGPSPKGFQFTQNIHRGFIESMENPTVQHFCQGQTILYAQALAAFGIAFRPVSLFSSINQDEKGHGNHSLLEFKANGKWIASDMKRNLYFVNGNGEAIGFNEMASLENWRPKAKNRKLTPEKVQSIRERMTKLMKFIAISDKDPIYLPDSWNGVILSQKYTGGSRNVILGHKAFHAIQLISSEESL